MSRQKATNYFSHDSNARNDDKLLSLRMHKGAAGYGVYFMLLERLREEADYMSVKDYNVLAFDLRVDAQLIKSVVEDFGLFVFTEDGKYFYSESFNRRMSAKDATRKLLSEAGRKGNEKRWGTDASSGGDTNSSGGDSLPTKKVSQQSKVKKSKEKDIDVVNTEKDALSQEILKLKQSQYWMENVAMRFHLTTGQVEEHLEAFGLDCRSRGTSSHTSIQDAQRHFNDWLRIQLKMQNNGTEKQPAADRRRSAKGVAAKTEDFSTTF